MTFISSSVKSLRITCYGSSSPNTPQKYLDEARKVGRILAERGHTGVNGGGAHGCMAALNDGALEGNGDLVGVVHDMFLIDGGGGRGIKGVHHAFDDAIITTEASSDSSSSWSSIGDGDDDINEEKQNRNKGRRPFRQLLVATGEDLQERKKLLLEGANALIVLPGGPGTWDELWEIACTRQLGISNLPIVCVSVDGYYDPFRSMLERAHQDGLLKVTPDHILHFCDTAEDAIRWIETEKLVEKTNPKIGARSSGLISSKEAGSGCKDLSCCGAIDTISITVTNNKGGSRCNVANER